MRPLYPKILGMLCFCAGFGALQAQAFVNPVPKPQLLDADTIELSADVEQHIFNPAGGTRADSALVRPVPTMAYNIKGDTTVNTYLGPTLVWHYRQHQVINVTNNMNRKTSVHWHGAHVPARMDGGPHQPIAAGATWPVEFDILDRPATLWYHPHAHDNTFDQVEMGLSGAIIVEDAQDTLRAKLPHTYWVDDFPIILQEKKFKKVTGTIDYVIDTAQGNQNMAMVNGVTSPYLEVPAQMVRLRMLDGSSRKAYQLGIGDSTQSPINFYLIASDAGYLAAPVPVSTFLTGSGIRNELVVDFTGQKGNRFYLLNQAAQMPADIIGSSAHGANSASAFLEIRVVDPTPGAITTLPTTFAPLDTLDRALATKHRTKQLLGHGNPNPVGFSINGNQFLMTQINDTIYKDSIEIWTIENLSDIAHPFHIHDISFFVLDVHDSMGVEVPMPVEFMGPKDNILIQVGWKVRFIAKFADFATAIDPNQAYMYHCHILTHEDGYYGAHRDSSGMMQQFVVIDKPVAVEEQSLGEDMTLYPNPTSGNLYLKGESTKPSTVRITDLQGRVLSETKLAAFAGEIQIPMAGIGRGMVLVEWQSAKGRFVRKVRVD